MKISLVVSIAASTLAALVVFATGASPVDTMPYAPPRSELGEVAHSAAAQVTERTGTIEAWHVLANGSVAMRLTGQDEKGEPFDQWFMTPGDKTETTRFEHLVLHMALTFAVSREFLTVAVEASTEKTGKTVKEAIPIQAVMWGFKPSDEHRDKKSPTNGGKR